MIFFVGAGGIGLRRWGIWSIIIPKGGIFPTTNKVILKKPPPYFIVLASSVKTKEVEVIGFHRILNLTFCRFIRWQSNISLESATFQLHFGFSSSFSVILHLHFVSKHIGLCFGSWDAEPNSVLTTLNTNTETNTAIHSSQFDSVGRNGHLLAALPIVYTAIIW